MSWAKFQLITSQYIHVNIKFQILCELLATQTEKIAYLWFQSAYLYLNNEVEVYWSHFFIEYNLFNCGVYFWQTANTSVDEMLAKASKDRTAPVDILTDARHSTRKNSRHIDVICIRNNIKKWSPTKL